jgi:hypothetical protein
LSIPSQVVTHEILRQASIALGGQRVWLWEFTAPERLEPRASSDPDAGARTPDVDVYSTIERWNIPVVLGSRWVGSRAWADGPWLIAPVRSRAPAPPPGGHERRSRERITLELAGLCLGLGDRVTRPDVPELVALPASIIQELTTPLAGAHAALQAAMESIGGSRGVPSERRLELLDQLGLANHDVERAISFLRSTQARLRTMLAPDSSR